MLLFPSGEQNNKTVWVRIYDDAEVELTEDFSSDFTITGVTDAQPGIITTHDFSIADHDMAPIPVPVITDLKVGTYNSIINITSPFAGNRIKHRIQSLYTAAELRAAGIVKAALIKSLKINVITKNSTRPYNGFTISMANSAVTTLSAGFTTDAFTTVYSGNYSTVEGENTFSFSSPFAWDGTSNIVIQICFDNGAGPVDTYADFLEGNTYPLGAGIRASTYANFTSGTTDGCDLPAALVNDGRYNATFGVDFGINTIATALNTNKTEYLNNSNDLYYYSPSGQIIARIRNLSGHNYGCTKVNIDRAGTGATRFWNNNKKNYLMDKTFQVLPDMKNSSGRYEITLYFSNAEKLGWEAATGNSWNDIQLVKVSGKISDVTPQNSQPNNNGTVQEVINATRGTYGGGHTLTAIFETGFGGFGAGTPGRQFNNATVSIPEVFLNENADQKLVVLNNPFDNQIRMRFVKTPSSKVAMKLYDVQGRLVANSITAGGQTITFNVSEDKALKAGIYFLEVKADGERYRIKVMKE